ncbi:MAG: tRNA (guanosine(46)-N7)-methyltransferase TrmB, partial [Alicycliphilus sp.]|nr:tRNA (guanosine(46)-N7)-methyltransferase TrmB [Alicycliphilus sp.]
MGQGLGTKLQSAAVTETPSPTPSHTGAPADIAHPKGIKSYVRRAGRTTTGQAKALEEPGPRYVPDYRAAPFDAPAA